MKFDFQLRRFIGTEQSEVPALVSHNRVTTWQQLIVQVADASIKIAQFVDKRHPVVILGHKQHEFVVIMLACIQLGIPYVPVDVIYPKERIASILNQLGQGTVINLDTGEWRLFYYGHCTVDSKSCDLMYILFTSGCTGFPKGVQITYNAFLDFWAWAQESLPMDHTSTVLNQSLFTFDVSMMDIAVSMGHGGTLLLVDRAIYQDFKAFYGLLSDNGCTDWISTPSFVTRWLMAKEFTGEFLPKLKRFTFIGEVLSHRIASELNHRFGDGCVYNSYGPTEATIAVSVVKIDHKVIIQNPKHLPIGYPKRNTGAVVVLDENGEEAKGKGEIVICGNNISVGYLDSTLDANSAFFEWHGMRAYHTGDYGYLKDGLLYYLGRHDDQIKLNGFRIEMPEIEKQLDKMQQVVTSVVLPLKRDAKVIRLIAFVFMEDGVQISDKVDAEIKVYLAEFIPVYMIPSEILCSFVSKIPYNSSNKIDRKYLLSLYDDDRLEELLYER